MIALPQGLAQAFAVSMGEIGFCSNAWLFVREIAAAGGDSLVKQLRDEHGRAYPVLDAVATDWLQGSRGPAINTSPVVAACRGLRRLLIIGLEADFLDALLPELTGIEVAILCHRMVEVDWARVFANYADRVTLTDLVSFQDWAGSQSGLLTFVYGHDAHVTHVHPAWLRLIGSDVKTQFRSILGWNVLRRPLEVYPRWLVETSRRDFSELL